VGRYHLIDAASGEIDIGTEGCVSATSLVDEG
jgi:hypothetical protein